ncbi:MAG: hypothetical protein AB1445_11430 [Bacillota bacterium]
MLYQGNRKTKATPLFEVEYSERHLDPLRAKIKCASANRLAALIPLQPEILQ